MRFLGWLIGCKIVERGDDHILIRMPFLFRTPRRGEEVFTRIAADYVLTNPGKHLEAKFGRRYVRLDVVEDA